MKIDNFFVELKRRNVVRMAGLYLVGAWLLVQVAGTVLPMFGVPAAGPGPRLIAKRSVPRAPPGRSTLERLCAHDGPGRRSIEMKASLHSE
jgi:hypothetical protein